MWSLSNLDLQHKIVSMDRDRLWNTCKYKYKQILQYNHVIGGHLRHSIQIRFKFRCWSFGSRESQTRFLPDWHESLGMIEMQSLKWSKHGLRKKNKEGQNDVSLTAATAFISKTRCHFYKPHYGWINCQTQTWTRSHLTTLTFQPNLLKLNQYNVNTF